MGFLSSIFGKPVDRVSPIIRQNTDLVDAYMKSAHENTIQLGDFTFEYLYTSSEPITQNNVFGSVIYIRIESPVHEHVAGLSENSKDIQSSIDKHQEKFSSLPNHLDKDKTRWMYFNMGKIFRVC